LGRHEFAGEQGGDKDCGNSMGHHHSNQRNPAELSGVPQDLSDFHSRRSLWRDLCGIDQAPSAGNSVRRGGAVPLRLHILQKCSRKILLNFVN